MADTPTPRVRYPIPWPPYAPPVALPPGDTTSGLPIPWTPDYVPPITGDEPPPPDPAPEKKKKG